jgi:DNA-directed RNA polymerase specialized sigma24 family protein
MNCSSGIEITEFMAEYYSILQELDPELREIILYVYERNGNLGLTYKEISGILGIK